MADIDEEEELARSKDQLAYEELVGNILEEEDDVVACHRQQIEDNMALVQVNPSPSPLASLIALLPL
jgi:hypothetical protein